MINISPRRGVHVFDIVFLSMVPKYFVSQVRYLGQAEQNSAATRSSAGGLNGCKSPHLGRFAGINCADLVEPGNDERREEPRARYISAVRRVVEA